MRSIPKIRLKVTDAETGVTRVCNVEEAKTWDWDNPEIMRLIGGWQITSYKNLLDVMAHKASRGSSEVELKVAPRFMLLAGG